MTEAGCVEFMLRMIKKIDQASLNEWILAG